jgi:hypothetical protein
MTATDAKACLFCHKPLKGRVDKKFCDDYCRNNYNNQLKSKGNHSVFVRSINNTLLKNRKILEAVLGDKEEGMTKASREKLLQQGFSFKYFTHQFINKEGKAYYYCYDYGYLPLGGDWYLIVRRKEE